MCMYLYNVSESNITSEKIVHYSTHKNDIYSQFRLGKASRSTYMFCLRTNSFTYSDYIFIIFTNALPHRIDFSFIHTACIIIQLFDICTQNGI